ncbi:hypothetical protein ACJRO7_004344 [Eucalyptus globulus]|uniref:TIR domain-containing protein n=1 Tax=Eucalyptus globulus TaxID=34317 RepID=A0ABD3IX46_EUCGL
MVLVAMKRKKDSDTTMSSSISGGDKPLGAEFEVFLNFRGPNTRLNFTDCLYHSLNGVGIRVFIHNEEIRKGEKIGEELLSVINGSKIYVSIFSINYAFSAIRLTDKVIIPIFFNVDPCDVKLRTGLYVDALKRHEDKFSYDEVQQWKVALIEPRELIKLFTDEVSLRLARGARVVRDHLVGIDYHVQNVIYMLGEDSLDVQFVIIHGLGRINKTTLANVVFNHITSQFDGCSFLSDISQFSQQGKIVKLQKRLLSDILKSESLKVHDTNFGINVIKSKCHHKKVLIVHDNLDKRDKLVKLAKKCEWFSPGSRIIVTTRESVFSGISIFRINKNNASRHPKVYYFYEMKEMDQNRAIQLFNRYAFESNAPPCEYDKITREIVKITGGLPLSLVVIGSSLYLESEEVCDDVLAKLKKKPHKEVQEVLKVSYDRLEYEHKEIFLDVACHMAGERRSNSIFMWSACQLYPNEAIPILINKSLIKIKNNHIWTHDQLKDLGRELVCRESIKNPREQSRIWCTIVPMDVIRKKEGKSRLKVLNLRCCKRFIKTPDFSTCLTLERLILKDCESLHLKHLEINGCNGLRMLERASTEQNLCFAPQFLPNSLDNLKFLLMLRMENMKLLELPELVGDLTGLQCLSLSHSSVIDLPSSIGKLRSLVELTLSNTKVTELPDSIGELKRLEVLLMPGCKLRKLPKAIGMLEKLKELVAYDCELLDGEVPSEIGALSSLRNLDLGGTRICKLPTSVGRLHQLESLHLFPCHELPKLPELPANLNTLKFKSTTLQTIPNVSNLTNLVALSLSDYGRPRFVAPSKEFGPHHEPEASQTPDLRWIGRLRKLRRLKLELSDVTTLPAEVNSLTGLQRLDIPWSTFQSHTRYPSNLQRLNLIGFESTVEWPRDYNLQNLSSFELCRSSLTDITLNRLGQKFENLAELYITDSRLLESLSNISSLKKLRRLWITNCPQLVEIRGLGQLELLEDLCIDGCVSLRKLPDLSYLRNLMTLAFSGCKSLANLPPVANKEACRVNIHSCRMLRDFDGPYHLY